MRVSERENRLSDWDCDVMGGLEHDVVEFLQEKVSRGSTMLYQVDCADGVILVSGPADYCLAWL